MGTKLAAFDRLSFWITAMLTAATLLLVAILQMGLDSMHQNRMAEEEILAANMSTEAFDTLIVTRFVNESKLAEVQNYRESE